MPKFYCKEIAELAHQLTISPRRLRMDQIRGIELLLELVETDRSYPFDFVCYHITKYRKRGPTTSASLLGKRLIGDLVTMAEVISRKANLAVIEVDEPYQTHQQVADELGVSTKTIRRWRNRGLLGIRVVFEDGVNRLAFCKSTVQRFVVRHRELVARGAAFRQLTPDERKHIVERAKTLLQLRPMKLHAAAKRIAEETGRAVETVRYTLRRYEESAAEPLFNRTKGSELCERYEAIWKCRQAGDTLEAIASAFECGADEIETILRHAQMVKWRAAKIECIASELFDAPNADELILGPAEPAASTEPLSRPPADTPPYLRSLYQTPLLTPAQETDLFRRFNYVKFKAARMLRRIKSDAVSAEQFEELSRTMAAVDDLRQRITRANLRLVVSIARKHVGWSPNFYEVISDGNLSLLRAIEKFDFARGVRFSTYATWAIMKNYARTIPEGYYRSTRFVTGQDERLDAVPAAAEATMAQSDRTHIHEQIVAALKELPQREREVVSGHFGLGKEEGGNLTLDQLGERFGVTKERVRQIERKALIKLRELLGPSLADLVGA